VFQSDRTGGWQIWRTDRDGNNPKQLTDGNEGSIQPQFSPDGQWVVYEHFNGNGIWKVSNNGGAPAQLTDQPSMRPTISPDGKWIAYWYYQKQDNSLWRLAIIPQEGGRPTKIFDLPPTVKAQMNAGDRWASVHWTPDGRALTYIDTRNGIANIWSQPVDGGKPVQSTNFNDNQIFSFDWSRDGKLLCSRGTEINDVVLIRDSK
jgi:tricorn protease-like protein